MSDIFSRLSVPYRNHVDPEQTLYLKSFSENTVENVNKIMLLANYFIDPVTTGIYDYADPLPPVYGLPFPETINSFDLEVTNAILVMAPGVCIINNQLIHMEEPVTLNLNNSNHFIVNALPHPANSTLYYYIIAQDEVDADAATFTIGFVKDEDFDAIRETSCILWVLEVETNGAGVATDVTVLREHPTIDTDYVIYIDGHYLTISLVDGGKILYND